MFNFNLIESRRRRCCYRYRYRFAMKQRSDEVLQREAYGYFIPKSMYLLLITEEPQAFHSKNYTNSTFVSFGRGRGPHSDDTKQKLRMEMDSNENDVYFESEIELK